MAGAELQWSEVKERGLGYFKILSSEMGLTFVIIVASIFVLQPMIPVLDGRGIEHVTVFALLVAAIAVAHSPAATLGLLTETRARGPVARTSLGVVLMSDVVLIILFTLVATIARTVVPPPGATHLPSLGMVVWEIAGALVVGGAIGAAVALYLRFTHRELLLFGIIVAMLGAEVARLAHVELLLTILVAGFIAENFAPHGRGAAMRDAVERAANPVFVVFFALSGASIALADVASMILIVAPLVLLRIFAIWAGCSFGGKWAKLDMPSRKYIWMGLVAQAGVAIGLATLVAEIYPQLGPAIQTLTLAMIAINQLVGPILFRRALDASGEIQATNSS